MKKDNRSFLQKAAILSISLMLTSGYAINGIVPKMIQSLEISRSQAEVLITAPSLPVVLFILLSGLITRKIGLKKPTALGLLIIGIAGSMPLITQNYTVMLFSRFALGAGLGLYNSIAVEFINLNYEGDTRATLLGFRNSAESLGQTILTIVAGILLNVGWYYSFAIYLLAFPILLLFWLKVPDIKFEDQSAKGDDKKERVNPVAYLLGIFAAILNINAIAIGVRFPSLVAEIKGIDYNTSNFIAMMPIIGVLAGITFGKVFKHLGQKTLYLGIGFFVASNFLIAFSGQNFFLLLIGYFLCGVPGAWISPFIFDMLAKITTKRTQGFAISLIFIGFNVGSFLAPYAMSAIEFLVGQDNLRAAFPIYGIMMLLIMLGFMIYNRKNFTEKINTQT